MYNQQQSTILYKFESCCNNSATFFEKTPHPRWGTPSPLLSENQRILKIFFWKNPKTLPMHLYCTLLKCWNSEKHVRHSRSYNTHAQLLRLLEPFYSHWHAQEKDSGLHCWKESNDRTFDIGSKIDLFSPIVFLLLPP